MFYEEVPVQKGELLGSVLSQYGFLPSDRDRILGNPHNSHIDPNMQEDDKFTGSIKIYLPIDLSTQVTQKKKAIDKKNGLRPRKIDKDTGILGPIICTHGVHIIGPNKSPQEFDDTPCGLSSETSTSLDFEAVLSAVVWTGKRITIASARHYRFRIKPGGNIELIQPFLAPATNPQIQGQMDILRKGKNQLGHNTGPDNEYRKPPANDTINGDKVQTTRRTYTVVSGDTLWKIAKRFYGNGGQWRIIYHANIHIIGPNPDRIFPGQTYVIP